MQPFQGWWPRALAPQGSSCLATLGWRLEPLRGLQTANAPLGATFPGREADQLNLQPRQVRLQARFVLKERSPGESALTQDGFAREQGGQSGVDGGLEGWVGMDAFGDAAMEDLHIALHAVGIERGALRALPDVLDLPHLGPLPFGTLSLN